MADLPPTSQERWEVLLGEVRAWYDSHVKKSPVERLTHEPELSPEEVGEVGKEGIHDAVDGHSRNPARRDGGNQADIGDEDRLQVVEGVPASGSGGEGGDLEIVGVSSRDVHTSGSGWGTEEVDEVEE